LDSTKRVTPITAGEAKELIDLVQNHFIEKKISNMQVYWLIRTMAIYFLAEICNRDNPEGIGEMFADNLPQNVADALKMFHGETFH